MTLQKLSISKEIVIDVEPRILFQALTHADEIVRVFPYKSIEADLKEGGLFVLRGEHDGNAFTDHGVIETFEPPEVFQYRYWSDNHGTKRTPENHLVIRYELKAISAGETHLHVTHEKIPPGAYHEMMMGAWDVLLQQLKSTIEA